MKCLNIFGMVLLLTLFACDTKDKDSEAMNAALQKAETIYQHPNGERHEGKETDTLEISLQLKDAAVSFVKRKNFEKAAKAYLYYGYTLLENHDKISAMKSLKDAEHYGNISGDSLTTARAQFNIARLLLEERAYKDILAVTSMADNNFGCHNDERAFIYNLLATSYILQKDYNSAESYLNQALEHAKSGHSSRAQWMIMNNYSVFYRNQGDYDNSINCLRQNKYETDNNKMLMFYINTGTTYIYSSQYDSAAFYIQKAFDLSKSVKIKPETEVSIYFSLYYIAKKQGRYQESLEYHETYTVLQYNIQKEKEKKNLYNIERRYDYEALQNQMNQKIIQKQRIILTISFILLLVSIVVIGLLARQKKIRKEDERIRKELDEMKEELQKSIKPEIIADEISRQLRLIISANRIAMRANDFRKEWSPLLYKINNEKNSMFEAAAVIIERVYPGMYSAILNKHPNLNETESKVLFLSCTDLTNAEIGDILGLTVHTVNKSKSEIRKKTL